MGGFKKKFSPWSKKNKIKNYIYLSVLWSTSVERFSVSRMRDFFSHVSMSQFTFNNRNFEWSIITAQNRNFGLSKILTHNRNFGLSEWTLVQIYGCRTWIWTSKFTFYKRSFEWSKMMTQNCIVRLSEWRLSKLMDETFTTFCIRPNGLHIVEMDFIQMYVCEPSNWTEIKN